MQKAVVKYSMIILLLMIYINRGLFVAAAYETESQDGREVNSVIEWVIQLITGEDNGIDEDGDNHSNCNFVQIVQPDFSQQISQNFELANLHFRNIEFIFPRKEDILQNDFYSQIDQPPEII
jgi:hypothetical protein